MTKAVWTKISTAAAIVLFSATTVFAQVTATGLVNVNAPVNPKAKLSVGPATLNFPDGDPDTMPVLTAPDLNVSVSARTAAAGNVTLTVVAAGDLVGPGGTITIDNLKWTSGSGGGFAVSGTSNKVTAQTVGSWTGSGLRSGTQVYTLPNSWLYATGTYTVTLTYTLTAP